MTIYQHPAHFGKLLFLDGGVFSEFGKATSNRFRRLLLPRSWNDFEKKFLKMIKKENQWHLFRKWFIYSTVLFYLIL